MRNSYWDATRGVAIIAVVCIHAAGRALSFPTETWNFEFAIGLRQLVNFAVFVFLALSGYFAAQSSIFGWSGYIRTRLSRILPAYLFWTLVYVLLLQPSHLSNPVALIKDVIAGLGIGIGYFVVVLAQMVVLTPLLSRLTSVRMHVALIAVGTTAGLVLTYAIHSSSWLEETIRFPYYALPFIVWYPAYHLGFLLGRSSALASDPRLLSSGALAYAIGIVASFAEAYLYVEAGLIEFAASQLKASSILTSSGLFLLVVWASTRFTGEIPSLFAWLGQQSYFIYLFHLLTFAVLQPALRSIPIIAANQPLYIMLLTLLSVTFSSAAAYGLDLIGSSIIQTWALGRSRASRRQQEEHFVIQRGDRK